MWKAISSLILSQNEFEILNIFTRQFSLTFSSFIQIWMTGHGQPLSPSPLREPSTFLWEHFGLLSAARSQEGTHGEVLTHPMSSFPKLLLLQHCPASLHIGMFEVKVTYTDSSWFSWILLIMQIHYLQTPLRLKWMWETVTGALPSEGGKNIGQEMN